MFRSLARLEIAEASDWYEAQTAGLGGEFLRALEIMLKAISRNPEQYQIVRGEVRRATLHQFPYHVFYAVSDDEIIVLTCVHAHRDPGRWPE